MIHFNVVIPARYASTRLPAKPLLDLGGKPMVVRVAERAKLSGAASVWVATDHSEVMDVVQSHGVSVVMTSESHESGTDRLAEVVCGFGWSDETIVVNVQGDEPLIDPALIRKTALQLAESGADIATVAHPLSSVADFLNPNCVKVVRRSNGDALYFSRAPIPFPRDCHENLRVDDSLPDDVAVLRHVGLYAYTVRFLKQYHELAPSPLEKLERLEQLRALWHGFRIGVCVIDDEPPAGVDTEEDAQRVKALYEKV